MSRDIHFLGEFETTLDVWRTYPNGGGYGDYVIIGEETVYWNEYTRSWGEPTETEGIQRPAETIPNDIDVHGKGTFRDGIYVGEGAASIDKHGNAEFKTAKVDNLTIKHNGKTIPLSEYIKLFKTELPPDWEEYANAPLFNSMRLLVFDPNSGEKYYTTVKAIKDVIGAGTGSGGEGGTGGGSDIQIIRTDDEETTPADSNVLSALRTLLEIKEATDKRLSKVSPDSAQALIKFLQGAEFGKFIPGMFGGKGARIDADGNMEATSLRLRALLEVPELRYNRLTVVGDELILTESGLIESVEHLEDDVYQLNMKLEEGDHIAFLEHDLIKGIFHHNTGFATSYMIVSEVGQTFMKVTLAANEDTPTNSNIQPMDFMNVARVGNATDPDRQRYIVASSKLGGLQVFDGCSTFKNGTLVGSMDAAQSFKDMYGELPLRPGLFYLYAAGLIVQDIVRIDYKGVPVREVYDRGPWQAGHTYYNNNENGTDDVWHLGCRWRCFSDNTTDEPGWTSQHWVMIEGRSDARMEFDSSGGLAFFSGRVNTTITPIVMIGNTDVSADIVAEQWSWTRDTGDEEADLIWQVKNKQRRVITLKNEDMGPNWSRLNPTRFTCTAIYPASSINKVESYINF